MVSTHLNIAAGLNIVCGVLSMCAGLFDLLRSGAVSMILGLNASPSDACTAIPIIADAGFLIGGLIMITPIFGILAGIGMYKRASWGRHLGVVVSVLYIMFHFPSGTLLGVYTLWVLLSADTDVLFEPPDPASCFSS